MIRTAVLFATVAGVSTPVLAQQSTPQQVQAQEFQAAVAARIGQLDLANMQLAAELQQVRAELDAARKAPPAAPAKSK